MRKFILFIGLLLPILGNAQKKESSFLNPDWYYLGDMAFSECDAIEFNLKVNRNNEIFVAYDCSINSPDFKLFVKKFNGSGWVCVGDSVTSYQTKENCLEFDPDDVPYVAFTEYTSGMPYVKKFDGNNWSDVGTFSGQYADYISLSVNSDGIPFLAYNNYYSPFLLVKKYDGTEWVKVGGNISTNQVEWINLAMSPDQIPYIAYTDYFTNKISVKKFNGTQWIYVGSQGFSPAVKYFINLKLAFSGSGIPYIAFADLDYNIHVMKFEGNSWSSVGDSIVYDQTNHLDLQISSTGIPYVAYGRASNVKKFDGNDWVPVGNPVFFQGEINRINLDLNYYDEPVVGFNGWDYHLPGASVMHYGYPLGTNDVTSKTVGVLPNPASDFINIDMYNLPCGRKMVEIIDRSGKTVHRSEFSGDIFNQNISDFSKGLYLIKVRTSNGWYTGKFLKTR
jgi:hypothetical protein